MKRFGKRLGERFGILFFILIFMFLGIKCEAQSQFSDMLTRVEKSLFGIDYSTQSDDVRLKRIETVVYGEASSSPIQQRVNKLSKDLSADLIGQEIKPKVDTFAEEEQEDGFKEKIPKADSNINYPSVDILEKSVFSKEFKTVDINKRLANLEQKVFEKTYNDDLNSRVERLKQAVMPERVANNADAYEDDDSSAGSYTSDSLMDQTSQFQDNGYNRSSDNDVQGPTGFGAKMPKFPSYNENNSVLDNYHGDSDILIPLGALEKKVLKKSYPNEVVSNRLLRMELKIFNSTFTDDDEQTRLDRIASAYQAKKSSKRYDNNTFAQHSSTAMQIGAILLMILAAVL